MPLTLTQIRDVFREEVEAMVEEYRRPALMTVKDVAEFLSVSPGTVEGLIKSGEIRPMRIGRQRRFDIRAIQAFIRSKST